MTLSLLLVLCCGLLLLVWALAPRMTPWADHLTRLNPGLRSKAEWMAPPRVVEQVMGDYRAAQDQLLACAANWGKFADRLDAHTTGAYLARQRRALASLVQARRPRLAAEFLAKRDLAVRHFSSDGLRCLLVERQTERIVVTTAYWTGRELHRQQLPDAAFVFQMAYDTQDKRWKIERLVQELPLGWGASNTGRVKESAKLPAMVGRDD